MLKRPKRQESPPNFNQTYIDACRVHIQALQNYNPLPLSRKEVQVQYFYHSESMKTFPVQYKSFWEELFQEDALFHQVQGNHISMNLTPHVQKIAEKIEPFLQSVVIKN